MRRYCEPKILTRILMPTPFLYLNVFRYQKFFETQKGSSRKSFGSVRPKKLSENLDTPTPLMHKKFLNQKFSETMKGSPTKCFGTVIQNISTENRDTLALLCMKTFDIRVFLNYRRVSLRSFSPLWGKKLLAENCNISLLCILFDSRKFVKNRRAPLRFFSGTVTQNNFDETSWYLLLSLIPKSFRYPKLVIHWSVPKKNYLELWHKKLKGKRDIPSLLRTTFLFLSFFDTQNQWYTKAFTNKGFRNP